MILLLIFQSANFLKICVLKVIQESSKHLEKILNVDEIVRRLYSVIHANDPVARAITLRYLLFTTVMHVSSCYIFISSILSSITEERVELI